MLDKGVTSVGTGIERPLSTTPPVIGVFLAGSSFMLPLLDSRTLQPKA